MEPLKSYVHMLDHLKNRFSTMPERRVRLFGILFCRSDNKLARDEILPALDYFNLRSGKNIDFYLAGFDNAEICAVANESPTGIKSKPEWKYDLNAFDELRRQFECWTKWSYSGGSDFMLMNCFFDKQGSPVLDFEAAIILNLERLKRDNRIVDVGMFFEKIFRHCEAQKQNDEAWGFGLDAQPGSALVELCNSFLDEAGDRSMQDKAGKGFQDVNKFVQAKNVQATTTLSEGPFRYDLATREIVMPSRIKHLVRIRFAEVFKNIFKREEGLYNVRVSKLSSMEVARYFELGRMRENNPGMGGEILKQKLQQKLSLIEKNAQDLAEDFKRQLSRWLRQIGIDPDFVITADRINGGYKLGRGWHPKRPVIGDSEASMIYASHCYENMDDDNKSGKTAPQMGTGDGNNYFDDDHNA